MIEYALGQADNKMVDPNSLRALINKGDFSVFESGKFSMENFNDIMSSRDPKDDGLIGTLKARLLHLKIPKGVTAVSKEQFKYFSSLQDVVVPNGVVSIGDRAFQICKNLAKVTLPNGLKSIGAEAFDSCRALVDINIPDSVSNIDESAFAWCSALGEITLPNGINLIANNTFYGSGLRKVVIPDGVISIGLSAFEGCLKLQEISVPKSVKEIAGGDQSMELCAFYMCPKSMVISGDASEEIKNIIRKQIGAIE